MGEDPDHEIGAVMFFTTDSMQPAPLARALEERGFESLCFPEHTHIPASLAVALAGGRRAARGVLAHARPRSSPLMAAAAATTTIKIGTGICLVIERDPIVTAKEVASLDFAFERPLPLRRRRRLERRGDGEPRHRLQDAPEAPARADRGDEGDLDQGGSGVSTASSSNFDKMKLVGPKPVQKPHPPIIVGGGFPHAARRAIRYGDGWIPRDDWVERDGMEVIDRFRKMATEAGRDPATLPISVFRLPDDIERLRLCEQLGIDRVVFSLPAAKEDKIMPILDRWAELKRQLDG